MTKHFFIVALLSTFFYISIFAPSCTSGKLDPVEPNETCDTLEVSYNLQVQEIITTNCAYVGCHISGFPSGDFSTYDNMLTYLNSGEIEKRTITQLDMPPPASGELTAEDLEVLTCWLSKGFPE